MEEKTKKKETKFEQLDKDDVIELESVNCHNAVKMFGKNSNYWDAKKDHVIIKYVPKMAMVIMRPNIDSFKETGRELIKTRTVFIPTANIPYMHPAGA